MAAITLDRCFRKAGLSTPFNFQREFAQGPTIPQLVSVPTGYGKTAMAVLGWLWRRRFAEERVRRSTPRRLVYCLPMRVLVEQTRDGAVLWLHNLDLLGGKADFEERDSKQHLRSYRPGFGDPSKVTVHVLMGGEDEDDWDIHPEREAIIIGTQDMLLSRALNRGYAAGRSRWPMQFGLLHTDCLWVFDEIQLMGSALATTAQLEAFRSLLAARNSSQPRHGNGCQSVWMSATMRPHWLKTVDFKDRVDDLAEVRLSEADRKDDRWWAKKPLNKCIATMGDVRRLAVEVRKGHKPGTRTIVVVNTVGRARGLFAALSQPTGSGTARANGKKRKKRAPATASSPPPAGPKVVLVHSRFRPADRAKAVEAALADPQGAGTIVVTTQVIEAGVDVSATTLFTELAPWASLIQRFGRCNRRGDDPNAQVYWIDLPNKPKDKDSKPYELKQLTAARGLLEQCRGGVGPAALERVAKGDPVAYAKAMCFEHTHVIRRKDLTDLFDTTPDLAGNDIDIDRFVREVEDSDVRVFWRDYGDTPNETHDKPAEPAPGREELCPVPIGEFRDFVRKNHDKVYRWNFLEKQWERSEPHRIAPGQVFLVHSAAGGYAKQGGWDPKSEEPVQQVGPPLDSSSQAPDANEDERLSRIGVWQTIAEHTEDVSKELDVILACLGLDRVAADALRKAARWHDRGKAHPIFVKGLPKEAPGQTSFWAKAPEGWKRHERRHFRHELAAALAVLDPHNDRIPDEQRDLVAYLVAAHHGKVRLSIRSLPNEQRPEPRTTGEGHERRFARGVWDGDELPETDLGRDDDRGRLTAPRVTLSLEPMEVGLCEQPPFAGQRSWSERMIRLRDALGPFRLAYLEAILRAADWRASKAAERRAALGKNGEAGIDTKEAGHG